MFTRTDLPPELEAFARSRVTSGRYSDTNEAIRAALCRLQDAEVRRIRPQRTPRPDHQELPHHHARSRPTPPLLLRKIRKDVRRHAPLCRNGAISHGDKMSGRMQPRTELPDRHLAYTRRPPTPNEEIELMFDVAKQFETVDI